MDWSLPRAPLSMRFLRQKYWSGLPFPALVSCIIEAKDTRGPVAHIDCKNMTEVHSFEQEQERRSVVSSSLRPHGLQPTRLLSPSDFPGNSTRVDFYFLLQRIFLTQGSNLGLPHCRQTLCHLSHQGSLELGINSILNVLKLYDNHFPLLSITL